MKALEIDQSLGEAHASLGIIKAQYDWDRAGAEKEFKRAIELNPNYASAHQWFGMYYFADGRFDQALTEFKQAQQLDPLSLIIAITAIWPLPHLGRHDEAVKELQKVMDMFPDVPDVASYFHELRGERYMQKGMYDDAVADFLVGFRTQLLTGNSTETLGALKDAYKAAGMRGYWQKQLDIGVERLRNELEQAKQQSPARYVSPYYLAELHARLGHKDQAFSLLQQCLENRDERLVWLKAESLRVDSSWETLRSDARFKDLLQRLGFGT